MKIDKIVILSILCSFATEIFGTEKLGEKSTLSLLTLNLHTYQEISTSGKKETDLNRIDALQRVSNYASIFDTIAHGIDDLKPDVICLQEVGEWKDSTLIKKNSKLNLLSFGNDPTNAVNQISSRIKHAKYFNFMDWSHYGWSVWKEGTAILSKYPILEQESRYISNINNGTVDYWQSRKVTRIKVKHSDTKYLNIFSIHTGWWDSKKEPFQMQFTRLMDWLKLVESKDEVTILCGDFNQPAGGKGYQLMIQSRAYKDLYLAANSDGMYDRTIDGEIDGWEGDKKGKRVDYLLMNDTMPYKVVKSKRVFTESIFGRVSDHYGVYSIIIFIPSK